MHDLRNVKKSANNEKKMTSEITHKTQMIHKPSDYTKLSHLAIFFNSKFSLLKLISKLKHPHYDYVPRKAGTLTVKLYFCKSCL